MSNVKTFVNTMNGNEVDVSKALSVKRYITLSDKIMMAKDIIDFSADYDRGFVKFDHLKRHMSFVFAVIEAHTDLRFADDWGEKIQEYDLLCENELLDVIIDAFRKDYDASLEVLNMMCADILVDNSLEASVAKLAQSATENLDIFVGALADKLENIDIKKMIPKDLDLDKLMGLLNKIK